MVNVDHSVGIKNNGAPRALYLWRKFKTEKGEETQKQKRKTSINEQLKQATKNDNCHSLSSSSLISQTIQTSKRSVAQEKLFKAQCESKYGKLLQESSFNSDSFAGSSFIDESHMAYDNMAGVLHLKYPLSANPNNAEKYYEDRGRMPAIDWKNAISNSGATQQQQLVQQCRKQAEITKKSEMQKETIKTTPVLNKFSNFVEHSVISSKTVYNAQGNIERNLNATDNSIFKIQLLINKKPMDTIQIPVSVRKSFLKPSFHCQPLLNKIDTFQADQYHSKLPLHKPKHNGQPLDLNVVKSAQNEHSQFKSDVQSVNNDEPYKDCCPPQNVDDCDIVTYMNSLTDEENAAKRECRKKGMAYDDDEFAFVQNSLESSNKFSSSLTSSAKKVNSHSYPFDRIKAVCREKVKVNSSGLDLDDTFNVSSNLESISVSRASSLSLKYEELKKKMKKITSSCNKSKNSCILPDENDDNKVLENKNQLLNRCLRSSHDYCKVHENNVVEITKVKVGPKREPLLKPISTHYFAKPSTDTISSRSADQQKLDVKIEEEHLIPSVSSIKNLEKCNEEKDNVNLENNRYIPPLSRPSEEANSKTDSEILSRTIDDAKNDKDTNNHMEIKKFTSIFADTNNDAMNCNYVIDPNEFDIENAEMFLVGAKEQNLKKALCSNVVNDSGVSTVSDDCSVSNNKSLESDFEISNNNYSSVSASISSNLNSDNENSSSPSSFFVNCKGNIFENVNIEFSKLKTDGFDYENLQLDVPSTNSSLKIQKKMTSTDSHESLEQNLNNNNIIKKSKSVSEKNVVPTASTKLESKKMKKYRMTLQNYKHKYNEAEADAKEENKIVERSDECQDKNVHQLPILKEIQKHKLHLTLRQFV